MIPVNTPSLDGNEKKYLLECIESGWISSQGPFIDAFEKSFAKLVGRSYGVAVSSGTAALDIAVKCLGIGPGDEVIMPTFTIISCASAIVNAGATPVVVDMDPSTWNMDASHIEAKISPQTKAIMVVHIYGLPVDMDPILALAKKYRLKIIEDAAEAIGQTYKKRPCGSFGDISVFSFYANKHITTGEGGMVMMDDPELVAKAQRFRDLCFRPEARFVHDDLGWNYRMTNMQAALGLAQAEKLPQTVQRKRDIGLRYLEALKGIDGLSFAPGETPFAQNIYWVFGMVLDQSHKPVAAVTKALGDLGIGTRPFFWCMHEQPIFQRLGLFSADDRCPHAEVAARRGFYLPSGTALTNDEIDEVCAALTAILVA